MWVKDYEGLKAKLGSAKAATILKQLNACEKQFPELHAAFQLLALPVIAEIHRVSRAADNDLPSVLGLIPSPIVDTMISMVPTRTVRDDLCRRINAWAAAIAFREFRQTGELRESGEYC